VTRDPDQKLVAAIESLFLIGADYNQFLEYRTLSIFLSGI
jgi:hypothetical protein